ncbi:hypothetical protein [Actinomadura kijaniata]|uniref:hypothetical protein n=1 Tax=Actinomadura kijaniata TaxID=46161 RepID=UPI000AA5C715|nr:hypothetical protein [Actinomadura kijaniata]
MWFPSFMVRPAAFRRSTESDAVSIMKVRDKIKKSVGDPRPDRTNPPGPALAAVFGQAPVAGGGLARILLGNLLIQSGDRDAAPEPLPHARESQAGARAPHLRRGPARR